MEYVLIYECITHQSSPKVGFILKIKIQQRKAQITKISSEILLLWLSKSSLLLLVLIINVVVNTCRSQTRLGRTASCKSLQSEQTSQWLEKWGSRRQIRKGITCSLNCQQVPNSSCPALQRINIPENQRRKVNGHEKWKLKIQKGHSSH